MNPKGLPVEVGDVITHVGDEPLPHAMPDPLRLVTSLVRSKRAQVNKQSIPELQVKLHSKIKSFPVIPSASSRVIAVVSSGARCGHLFHAGRGCPCSLHSTAKEGLQQKCSPQFERHKQPSKNRHCSFASQSHVKPACDRRPAFQSPRQTFPCASSARKCEGLVECGGCAISTGFMHG